jgi:small subunit ribosomal protein S1
MADQQLPVSNDSADSDATMTMAELLEQAYDLKAIRRGDILTGTIVNIAPNEILIDIGSKSEGIVAGRELDRLSREDIDALHVGQEIPVYVVRPEDEEGNPILSLTRAQAEKDWLTAQKMYESGEVYEGQVVGQNKGGLIVHFGQIRGFVPGSQLSGDQRASGTGGEGQWDHMLDRRLTLKIIEIDRRRNRLIFSERAAVEEERKKQKEELLDNLKEGDVLTGRVTSLADFGAFVDLGGADGLIHLSELSWSRVSHPRDLLRVGDETEVYVLNIDTERQRIGLSLKRLQAEPWTQVLETYEIGQIVDARITKLANFGAFAQIGHVEGLIHLSELTDDNITHPREVVQEGEQVSVKIIRIDPDRRRMGLSLKQAEGQEDWEDYQRDEDDEDIEERDEDTEEVEEIEDEDLEEIEEVGEELTSQGE